MRSLLVYLILSLPLSLAYSQTSDCPCCTSDHQAFDFWIGEYDVYAKDKLVGKNVIAAVEDNCILRETYHSTQGAYSGTSYNYYNRQEDRWEQLWLDNQGGILKLKGNIDEQGRMVLSSEGVEDKEGNTVFHRITWTPNPDGSVRQHWESRKIDSREWETVFDGLYKRVDS